jgi:DNA-binding CsgD family transcriptional regulator
MNQLVLWLNMISFALMTAATGLLSLIQLRTRRPWLANLMVYTAAYALWLLFGTWVYFQEVFLADPIPSVEIAFAYVRVAVSFVVLYAGSKFALRLAVDPWQPRVNRIIAAATLIVAVLVTAFLGFGVRWASPAVTIFFNFYLAAVSFLALRESRRRSDARQRMVPFLLFSVAAYVSIGIIAVVLTVFPTESYPGIPLNVLTSGLFTALWGLTVIIIAARWLTGPVVSAENRVPEPFFGDFGISPREREIVEALRSGSTSREIGEKLFISQRTVETHLNNVYRKCRVGNRVELVNLINRYLGMST